MESRDQYSAPMGGNLRFLTGLCLVLVILVAGASVGFYLLVESASWWILLIPPLLFASLAAAALFAVRGYEIESDVLLVRRPGRRTRVPLDGLESADADREAVRRSIRIFGLGGFLANVGYFRSSRLGGFTAYLTDSSRAVILRFPDRTVAVSPDRPEEFVARIRELRKL